MEDKDKPRTAGKRLLIIFLCFIVVFLLMSIIIPSLHFPGPSKYCHKAQDDARKIYAAISDYFADPNHSEVKPSDIKRIVDIENPWTFSMKSDEIIIQVTDGSGKCPDEYQNKSSGWDSGIYTYRIMLKGD